MPNEVREFDSLIDLLEDLEKDGITGYQKQQEFKRFLNLMARMRGRPNTGGFELTPLCNFDCKMCYVHLSKAQMEKEANLLTTEQWINIIGQAVDAGIMHADLTGGECLSYPGFKEVYLYLLSRGVEVSILSNGQLITEEMADFFAKYPPSIVQITVYGSNDDAYERVTGRRAFADVKEAIERLKKRGIRMLLTVTPNQFMLDDAHDLLEFLRGTGVRYAIGTGSLPARPGTGRLLENYSPEADLYVKLHRDERNYKDSLSIDEKQDSVIIERIPKGFKSRSRIGCSSGQCTFHINWKGEMQPCIPFYTVKKSVLEFGFPDCWEWIQEQMAKYEPPKECAQCSKNTICSACPADLTLGILNGPLNTDVCNRYECFLKAGILRIPDECECRQNVLNKEER